MSLNRPLAQYETPAFRRLEVYAIDPSLARQVETFDVATASLPVPWDDLKEPGPIGRYLEVVDYDPAAGLYYLPVDLTHPHVAAEGLPADESDPRFHQQMVYAVAMSVIGAFEGALGRQILWAERAVKDPNGEYRTEYVDKLRIHPHALRAQNAYYDPERKALLFGCFPPTAGRASDEGGSVFTCLSFDIIAHEVTHAILDGLHPRLKEATNPDVLAFHEAFADIVALFSHFSLPEFLERQIFETRGDLEAESFLSQIAVQFGRGIGAHGALRDALGSEEDGRWKPKTPDDPELDLDKVVKPHARGAILVTCVFSAFLKIYRSQTKDLMRIASEGTGILKPGAIHPDLARRLAREAATIAKRVLRICIRALDYLPPVDVTFEDYALALLTADFDRVPYDPAGYRAAFIHSFQEWRILPFVLRRLRWDKLGESCDTDGFSSECRLWLEGLNDLIRSQMGAYSQSLTETQRGSGRRPSRRRRPPKASDPLEDDRRRVIHEWSRSAKAQLHAHLSDLIRKDNSFAHKVFGICDPSLQEDGVSVWGRFEVHTCRPLIALAYSEESLPGRDLVFSITQSARFYPPGPDGRPDMKAKPLRMRGGSTVLYDLDKEEIRYVVHKDILSQRRRKVMLDYMAERQTSLYFGDSDQTFRALHLMGGGQ